MNLDISFNDVLGLAFSADEFLNDPVVVADKAVHLISLTCLAQQAFNGSTQSFTDLALKVSNAGLGFLRSMTSFTLGNALHVLITTKKCYDVSKAGWAAAAAIVFNRLLAFTQNKVNGYFNSIKA